MTPTPDRPDRRGADPVDTGPRPADDGQPPSVTAVQAERIAPFVAWMATQQDLGETVRREHREAVDAFLTWCVTDDGEVSGRRRRYEAHLQRSTPQLLATARAGLDRYAQYRELVARTLPIDHH